mmetsp:Transcript_99538/g.171340  ORF Transcript_99538/g.171340 Transcript_99538/m.171340 type:complete len:632 (-) Transcript_99538:343-2238(-)
MALNGMRICLTGTMSVPRKEMQSFIESNGGSVAAGVTGNTTHLMTGAGGFSSKEAEAKKKGVPVLSEDDIRAMVTKGAGGTKRKAAADPVAAPLAKVPKPSPKVAKPPAKQAKPAPKPAPKKGKAVADAPAATAAPSPADDEQKQKLTKKGRGVVDVHSGLDKTAHVFEDGDGVWQCTLNQTNIGDNNNKFYIIQVLEADSGDKWWVWNRWGRVGVPGQSKLEMCSHVAMAKLAFVKKYHDKTGNVWGFSPFEKRPGKYMLMDMDYGEDSVPDTPKAKGSKSAAAADSKLDPRIQAVMALITDKTMMANAMAELELDTKKMPLGKISKSQVKQGYEILSKIADAVEKKNTKPLMELSSQFYTIIPHVFGMRQPPVINDSVMIKKKLDMLDMLADLEIACKLMDAGEKAQVHPLDAAFASLRCKMVPMNKKSPEYKMLCEYVKNTHGKTHTMYTLEVEDILEIEREGEVAQFKPQVGNRHLLWHGSRLGNFMGILSQGLRIAPPEAPCTGYMFGKGVYFADMVTKSANYCRTNKKDNKGIMLLADVALGEQYKLTQAKYMEKAPKGYHSTMGTGRMVPDSKQAKQIGDVTIPLGKATDAKLDTTSLLYNEFIIYDVAQCNLKYLFKMNFKYK